jgi:hypothetical protein
MYVAVEEKKTANDVPPHPLSLFFPFSSPHLIPLSSRLNPKTNNQAINLLILFYFIL